MKIRLIGTHPKECEENWRDHFKKKLSEKFDGELLDDFWEYGVGPAVVAHDALLIKECDFIVANCNENIGPGTAMEYLIAKKFKKFVISVISKNSEHRKMKKVGGEIIEDWIHPFIETFSDLIVETIEEIPKNIDIKHAKDLNEIDRLIKILKDTKHLKGINSKESRLFKKI